MDSSTVEKLIPDQSHACLFLMVDDILKKTTQADFRKNVKHMIVKFTIQSVITVLWNKRLCR